MNLFNTSIPEPDFKDRKVGLILFGILQLGLGGLCALMVPLMIIGLIASQTVTNASPQTDPAMMIPGMLFYVIFATWFIGMGIGSIRAKRWARALILTTSWIWLISGIGALATMWYIMPDMYAQMAADGKIPQSMAEIMTYMIMGFMTLFYILLPGALVLFYRSRHVKATCELNNPKAGWTDRCPLPVLAISLLFALWAACLPSMGLYGWVLPFFGVLLSGTAGAVTSLTIMALLGWIAWGSYKLDKRAWIGSIGLVAAWALSIGVTFSRISLMDLYKKMNFSEEQLELMQPICETQMPMFTALGALWVAGLLGYLLYTHRFYSAINTRTVNSE